jgi:hypothetical protein
MIWNKFEKGICFEGTDIFIPWYTPMEKLKDYGHPEITNNAGRIIVTWKDKTLLKSISGAWSVSFFSHESETPFKMVQLSFMGDSKSFEAYSRHKEYLQEELGVISVQKESNDENETKWINGNLYIWLYLFEMHAFRYNLTIGIL